MIRMVTPILSIISAKLKIGKFKILILIKSLTPHRNILSMRFPIVPDINNDAISRLILFVINNRINVTIPTRLISMMIV